jgi:DNA-binding Lrp family transcriptional regulator
MDASAEISEKEKELVELLLHEENLINPDLTSISKKLGVTPGTVKNWISNMKMKSVILGFIPVTQLGNASYHTIQAKAGEIMRALYRPSTVVSEKDILGKLLEDPRIERVDAHADSYDIKAKVGIDGIYDLTQFIKDLGLEITDVKPVLQSRRRIGPYIVTEGAKGAYK